MKTSRMAVLTAIVAAVIPLTQSVAQTPENAVWTILDNATLETLVDAKAMRSVRPTRLQAVQLNPAALDAVLAWAPRAYGPSLADTSTVLEIPTPNGSFERFVVVESPVMHPQLQRWLADQGWPMRTYKGKSLDRAATSVRFDWGGPAGFHAMVLSPGRTYYIDPYMQGDRQLYASYFKRDYGITEKRHVCHVVAKNTGRDLVESNFTQPKLGPGTGGDLRVYRLAVAATGEYTAFHGGTQVNGQAAIVTTINRVNQVYERDLSVHMTLVANNNLLVYVNANGDPYTNGDAEAMLGQNQINIDLVIGNANYDIGHVVGTGGGGLATLSVSCTAGSKARGMTGSAQPVGDPFDIDFVAHELGHQWGGNHTFNSETANCGGGNRNAATAYEPGSGSTIMAYAGICGVDDIQPNSDDFFHGISLDEMLAYVAGGGGCSTNVAAGNPNAPAVDAGNSYTIPISTAFELTVDSSSDAGGDSLTYSWEEFDLGPAGPLANGDNGSSPVFRAWDPSMCPIRVFPRLEDLIAGGTALGETLPTTTRTMNFRVTVRDNHPGGGRVSEDAMSVTSTTSAGPFEVTSPNGSEIWQGTQTITWNVAGTDAGAVATTSVDILLSLDGGETWPLILLFGTPNDGSESVTIPAISTSAARIKIKGSANVFFDLSDADFTIVGGSCVFSDIDGQDWFLEYVDYACDQGNVNGFADGTYRPAANATRAEVLKMAYESSGEPVSCPAPETQFVDVNTGDWFYYYVADAKAKGFIEGNPCPGGGACFFPNENINRAEALKMVSVLYRIGSSQAEGFINVSMENHIAFPDVPEGEWFFPYVNWMANAELTHGPFPNGIAAGQRIINGYPDGFFRPGDEVNRAEMAKIITNIQQYFGSGSSPIPAPLTAVTEVFSLREAATGNISIGALYEQAIDPGNFNAPDPLTLPGGNQQTVTGPITLTGATHDTDGDELFYFWTVDGGTLTTTDPVDFTTVEWTPPTVGSTTTFTLTAIAGDRRGKISRSIFSFTVSGGGQSALPTITVTDPDTPNEIATESYVIRWTADDPDSNATISLYYDIDSSSQDGTPISGAGSLSEDSSLDQYNWDTSSITPGTYYIYAKIDDNVNPPQYSYSTGTVKVEGVNNQPVDPYNWRLVEYVPGMNYQGIGYGAGTYIAVGKRAAISLSGNEGLSWGHHGSTNITDDMDFYDAHYHNGRWILVGEDNIGGFIIHSDHIDPDGSNYQWVIPTQWYGDTLRDIHYADGKWVAVGHSNLIMYSTDNGDTWNQGFISGSSFNFKFQAVTYDSTNDTWIAVSESSTNRSQVATSSDGINWTQRDFFNTTYRLQGVVSNGGQAAAVGYKTTPGDKEVLLTSADGGLTWTDASAGSQALFDVVYRPDGWVAVGNDSIAVSNDGASWQRAPSNLGYSMNAVAYAPDEENLVAVLHSRIYRARTVGSSLHHLIEIQVFGSGTVAGAGFSNCSDYCVNSWPEGSVLPLTATAAPGWLLSEWGGSCNGTTGNQCQVILTQNESIDVVFEVDDAPTINVLEPDGVLDKAHQSYTITWTDSDPDSSASILLYYDLDNDGANGTLITQGAILEDDESDRYFWDTSPLAEDDYYIYAVINDGTSPPVTSVSSGPITVIHNAPPRLTFLEPNGIDDTEDLSYTISWTDQDPDNDASIDLFYDTNGSGADGTPIPGAQGLSEDDETDQYVWDITGLPEQDFYVYATISDGVMDPFTVYSPGPLTVLHVSTNIPPTLSFVEPDGVNDTADQSYGIVWIDEDPDNDAGILLFYDDDNVGGDGLPINQVAISEDDETDLLTWDTSPIANGDYYVYAVIDDNVRPPVTVYSSGPLTVSHANAVPSITLQEPDGISDSADQSFTITWTDEDPDDDATISLYYDMDDAGADGILIASSLSEDDETDSYSWGTAGVNGGDYYIYAVIDDGSHTPLTVYSTGRVSVDHEAYGITWARQAGGIGRDRARGVAVDSAGNSYVTGHFKDDVQFGSVSLVHVHRRDAFLAKYDPNGNVVWALSFGGEDDDYGMGVAVDSADNVYVTGYFENTMQFDGTVLTAVGNTDVFVAKLSSGGSSIWSQRFGVSGFSQALSIDVAGNGDIYFTGNFSNQISFGGTTLTVNGNSEIFVAKLNTNGQPQWAQGAGGSATSDSEAGYGIAAVPGGGAVVTGQFSETGIFGSLSVENTNHNPDIFVVKYSSNGTAEWVRAAGAESYDRGSAIAADASGNVYATGWFERDADFDGIVVSSAGHTDIFLAKYSPSGIIQWVKQGSAPGDDRGHAITLANTGEIFVAGQFSLSVVFEGTVLDGTGGFAAQYSADGSLEWVRPAPVATSFGLCKGVGVDSQGDVILAGDFASDVSFDLANLSSLGDSDVFVAKIERMEIVNSPPAINIVEPDGVGDIATESYVITWADSDPDDDAQILLFFDDDASGEDGTLLTPIALSEDDMSNQYPWDVSTVTPGDYYIYARIQDSSNPAVVAYSSGPLTVIPPVSNVAPTITILEPDGVGDTTAGSYLVTWTDDDPDHDATIDLFYDADNGGTNGEPIAGGLSENDGADSFLWDTSGVPDGNYYVYAVIDDGVDPAVVSYSAGPVTVDSTPPRIAGVGSTEDTGDGQLLEGELASVNIWQLLVTFDEAMWNPPGNGDSGDVTNSSSYRVSVDSGDGFDPAGCSGGLDPEDVQVVVSYAAASRTATLSLQGGGLADGTYRLLVCGTLLDEAGSGLDGNGDGSGGDDFALTFSVDATPPQVSSVASDPDTGDGVLAQDEATNLDLTGLSVVFSEVVYDPPGDGGVDDVTNPANYLLFSDGGDGFDTVDCAAGVDPGDAEIAVDAVSYDAGESTATLAIHDGVPLPEGKYRLQGCGTTSILDLAGSALDGDGDGSGGDDFARTFLVDQSMPSNPAVSSLTHVAGAWSPLSTVGMEWSGASDTGGSDVAGYSVLFDLAPTSVPDTAVDVPHAADPHAASSDPLPSGGHYFHLRTCDAAGNCTAAVHLGPFLVDTSAPVAASDLTSSSHPVGVPVDEAIIAVSWNPAVDAESGVAGYASAFDAADSWACDQSQDLAATATGVSSPALSSGSWYFHLCAVDLVGNWSEVATAGPFVVAIEHDLSITTDGSGEGEVVVLPGGTTCTGTCTETFPEGTEVTLTPSPAAGSAFAGWSGDCGGTGDCALTMDADKAVSATFVLCTYTLSHFNALAPRGGLQASFEVTSPAGCAWTAASGAPFVTVTSGADGDGDGTVTFDVAANVAGLGRLGSIDVAGQAFMVHQAGIQIDAGANHSLFLQDDGTVLAWGRNLHGQLGDGTTTRRHAPVLMVDAAGEPLTAIAAVSAQGGHTLLLAENGDVLGVGLNTFGQAGDGTQVDRLLPGPVLDEAGNPLTGAVAVAAGGGHSVVLMADGTVLAWGKNTGGQLGDGTQVDRLVPAAVTLESGEPLSSVVALAAGNDHALVRTTDGTTLAWGVNGNGRLGDGTTALRLGAVQVQTDVDSSVAGVLVWDAGDNHSLARHTSGDLLSWGGNSFGQLGNGGVDPQATPGGVLTLDGPPVSGSLAVAGGSDHSLALQSDGTLYAWGRNHQGQVGDGTLTDRHAAVTVIDGGGASVDEVVRIAAGWFHSLALRSDGTLLTWGDNGYGQLGDGTETSRSVAVPVNGTGAQLAVALTESADPVDALTGMTLTLGITNLGRSAATNVVLDLQTDAAVTSAFGSGWTCSTGSGTAQCTAPSLPLGSAAAVTVEITAPSEGGMLTHTATVSADEVDPEPGNNTATESTTVTGVADLALAKADSPDPMVAGDPLTYTLTVTNLGPSSSSGGQVTDVLPVELSFASSADGCSEVGGTVTCAFGPLAAGGAVSLSFVVAVDPSVVGLITNTATVTGNDSDPVPGNDNAGETTQVDNSPPVLDPVGGPFTVNAGELLSFTATAGDPNGDGLAFSLGNAPSGASIDPITGVFTWTPTAAQGPQTYSLDVVVTDDDPSDPLSDSETIQIDVEIPDVDPPTVVRVDTVTGTGDGELSACETARVDVTEVLLTFNEALLDPPGDIDTDDVTNPDNYLLLASGPDRDFDTDLCGTLFGDDEPVVLGAVTWDEPSRTTTLVPALAPLADAPYRLIACGSTSLYDLAGNPLDGDGDGVGGDDFLMDFRVDADNAFDNGHLDCGLEPWIAISTNPAEIAYSSEDVDGSSLSGSVHLTNLTASTDFTLSQCVAIEGGRPQGLTARFSFEASPGVTGSLSGICEYFDQTACIGISLGVYQEVLPITDTDGQWISLERLWIGPEGSASVMCTYGLVIPGGESFDAYLDDLFLPDRGDVFLDGFESGDTSAWGETGD